MFFNPSKKINNLHLIYKSWNYTNIFPLFQNHLSRSSLIYFPLLNRFSITFSPKENLDTAFLSFHDFRIFRLIFPLSSTHIYDIQMKSFVLAACYSSSAKWILVNRAMLDNLCFREDLGYSISFYVD